jgi:hypothetical protein
MFGITGEIASYDGRGFCAQMRIQAARSLHLEDGIIEIRIGSLAMHRSS